MAKLDPIDRLSGDLIFVAIKAAILSYTAVVRTGVVSPDEVEQYIDALTDHIQLPDDPEAAEQVRLLRDLVDGGLLPMFARLREAARHYHRP